MSPAPRKRRYPEWELQQSSAEVMQWGLRKGAFALHPANERADGLQRQILSGGGVTPGAPDWLIFAPATLGDHPCPIGCPSVFAALAYAIELKAGKRKQSPSQIRFQERCTDADMPYAVCRSLDEVVETLRMWGLLRPGFVMEEVARCTGPRVNGPARGRRNGA